MKYIIYFSVLTILFSSCDYEIENIEWPEFNKQLVVHSYISPYDTLITATIEYSYPIQGNSDMFWNREPVKGVRAYLSDGVREAEFSQMRETFFLDAQTIPIKEGKTYYLRVVDSLGNMVSAECKIPFYKEFEKIEVDTMFTVIKDTYYLRDTINNTFRDTIVDSKCINLNLNLFPKNENRYNFRIFTSLEYYTQNKLNPNSHIKTVSYLTTGLFFSGSSNQSIYLHHDEFSSTPYSNKNFLIDSVIYQYKIMQVNEDYYKYYLSIDDYMDFDSFFTEISPIYSNIKGGLGIFCGYTQRVYSFKINKDMVEFK